MYLYGDLCNIAANSYIMIHVMSRENLMEAGEDMQSEILITIN